MISIDEKEHITPIVNTLEEIRTLTGHRWPRIYRDWTEIIFASLQRDDKGHGEIVESYKSEFGEETGQSAIEVYSEAFAELQISMQKTDADLLGRIFEEYGPSSDREGQFFTPEAVSELLASISTPTQEELRTSTIEDPIRVQDPTCGSGRMLLATAKIMNRRAEAPFTALFYGQDKDYTCAKMTAINFALRGLPGVVTHGDSLKLEARNEWNIKPWKGMLEGKIEKRDTQTASSEPSDSPPGDDSHPDVEGEIPTGNDADVDVAEQVDFSAFTDGGTTVR